MHPAYIIVFVLAALLVAWIAVSVKSSTTARRVAQQSFTTAPRRPQGRLREAIRLANEQERFGDAIQICRRIVRDSRNPVDRHNALMTLEDIRTEVRARRNLDKARERAERQLETLPVDADPERDLRTFPELFPVQEPGEWEEDFIVWALHQTRAARTDDPIMGPMTTAKAWADPQNVHDSAVQDDIVAAVNNMAAQQGKTVHEYQTFPDTTALREAIGRLSDPDKRESALVSLNYIQANQRATLSRLECTIGQVFAVVILHIDREPNEERRQVMYDMLALELADCQREGGGMLCLTGIVTRVVASLDGIDDSVRIRPEWAVREELMSRAGVHHAAGCGPEEIRRKLHKEYDPQIGSMKLERYIAGWLEAL
jgi:hypothetical protein